MHKYIIVGSAGSGKSTLAKNIAKKLHIPHVELDSIYYKTNWEPLDDPTFRKIVTKKTDGQSWVVCGNYFSHLGIDFWKTADTIIWCDYPFPLVFGRLLKRTLHRTLFKDELWHGNTESFRTNFFSKDSLILWMIKRWSAHKKRYTPLFEGKNKDLKNITMIRLKKPADAEALLAKLH